MSRTANPDIGQITCPFTGELSPVRRYRTGQRLAYFCSKAGQIKPNLEAGQQYIYEKAVFNDPEDKRQIGRWLESRGIQIQPEIDDQIFQDEPEMVETIIGGDPEPVPGIDDLESEPAQEEEKSIFNWFSVDEDEE